MKFIQLTLVALAIASAALPANAREFGRTEKPGDMNIFQIEPTVLNERFYTSGNSERHQYVGNVLPAGAPIPDNDAPLSEQAKPVKSDAAKPATSDATKTAPAVSGSATTSTSSTSSTSTSSTQSSPTAAPVSK